MRCTKLSMVLVAVLCLGLFGLLSAEEPQKQYLADAATYFEVEPEVINDLIKQGVVIEEIPVILLISMRTKSSATQIATVRVRGDSWPDIINGRSISTEIFYIMISGEIVSKVYAPIFAKFASDPSGKMIKVPLSEDDVINMANLRFISSQHDYSIFEVMAMRDMGKEFAKINQQISQKKAELIKEEKRKKAEASKATDDSE